MDSIYNTIIQNHLGDIVMIATPAVVIFGYILYSCCRSIKVNDDDNNDTNDTKEYETQSVENNDSHIHDKNSKLAFMLMMLLAVEPRLNEKYMHFARNIGYDHIVEDIAQEPESE